MRIRTDCVFCYAFRRRDTWEVLQLFRAPGRFMENTWAFVSGGVEPGETMHAAALRELREETTLTPTAFFHGDHVKTYYLPVCDELFHAPTFAAIVDADAAVVLNDEHTDHRWVPIEDVATLWTDDRVALQTIERQILHDGPAKEFLRIPL
ncbi:MAG: NUDIX domain-containing protein [Planctomycetota bacterium]